MLVMWLCATYESVFTVSLKPDHPAYGCVDILITTIPATTSIGLWQSNFYKMSGNFYPTDCQFNRVVIVWLQCYGIQDGNNKQ